MGTHLGMCRVYGNTFGYVQGVWEHIWVCAGCMGIHYVMNSTESRYVQGVWEDIWVCAGCMGTHLGMCRVHGNIFG